MILIFAISFYRLAQIEVFAAKCIPAIQSRLTKANSGTSVKGKAVNYSPLVWDLLSFFAAHCGSKTHALLAETIM